MCTYTRSNPSAIANEVRDVDEKRRRKTYNKTKLLLSINIRCSNQDISVLDIHIIILIMITPKLCSEVINKQKKVNCKWNEAENKME